MALDDKGLRETYSLTKDQFQKYSNDFEELDINKFIDIMAHQNALYEKVEEYESDLTEMLKENEHLKQHLEVAKGNTKHWNEQYDSLKEKFDYLREENITINNKYNEVKGFKEAIEIVFKGDLK